MSLVFSLFCPLCQHPYDDTNKRPRHGACNHSVCHQCFKKRKSAKCPICNSPDAFKEVSYNYQLESTLLKFQELSTDELQTLASTPRKLGIGKCKTGDCDSTESLRICVTCAEDSKLFKKLPNGKFQILEENKLVYLSKSILYCSNCIANGQIDHPQQHLFLPFFKINVIDLDLEFWNYMIHATFVERKLRREENKPASNNADFANRIVLSYKRDAQMYEAVTKSQRFQMMLEQFRFSQQKQVDIHSIPELAVAKEKSVEMARKVIERSEKLLERQLWLKQKELKNFVEFENAKLRMGADSDKRFFIDEITALSHQFNSLKITDLTDSEAADIDQETVAQLKKAIEKLGLSSCGCKDVSKKFLVYKAVCNILQEALDKMKIIGNKCEEEMKRYEEYFTSRMETLEGVIDKETEEAQLTLRLLLFEMTENTFAVDKLLLDSLEADYERMVGQFLWARYFPTISLYTDSEEGVYNLLLQKRFVGNDYCLQNKMFLDSLGG